MSDIKVKVIDRTTLELLEDAKAGDHIDLSTVQMIDTDFINELISSATNNAVKERLEEQNRQHQLELVSLKSKLEQENKLIQTQKESEKNIALNNLEKSYESKIVELNNKIMKLSSEAESIKALNESTTKVRIDEETNKIREIYSKEISLLNDNIHKLETTIAKNESESKLYANNEVEKVKAIYQKELQEKINEYNDLKNKFENAKELSIKELENQKLKLEESYKDLLNKAEMEKNKISTEYENLKLTKAHQNVKQLGEELEKWCNEEYEAAKLSGFENCLWEKDNDSVKDELDLDDRKSKADYIFKMYINDEFKPENEITSVCLEMKNESPDSVNKKTNESHYKKLDNDRKKKNCEFALLVSELEWGENDAPIKKVSGYEKMYMVRPPYMITFLSIVYSLGKKYRDLILSVKENDEELKDIIEIENEFEHFKETYVLKPIDSLSDQLEKMRKNSSIIIDAANKINNEIDLISSKTIANILTKIEKFTVQKNKLLNKIEKTKKD